MLDRLRDYHGKLQILRQIMSNKAKVNRAVNTAANAMTVIVASALTFMGFAGPDSLTAYVGLIKPVEVGTLGVVFNLLVLFVFILVILHLVFRFSERQAAAEKAVVALTQVLNRVEDEIETANQGFNIGPKALESIRHQYDTVIQNIPANSDGEFIKAKKDFQKKQIKKASVEMSATGLFDQNNQERVIKGIVMQSPLLLDILRSIRAIGPNLYLGGGLVRNATWDYLHGYDKPTPIDDVDVIYFDDTLRQKENDLAIENRLAEKIPNLKWSAKNQARMHEINDEDPYESLDDAIAKWPETATAIAVRLLENGDLDIIAPHGYSDLFRLVVRPTPWFSQKIDRYRSRIEAKSWRRTWPRLLVIEEWAALPSPKRVLQEPGASARDATQDYAEAPARET